MKFFCVWPGKTRNQALSILVDDYAKRISKFFKIDFLEIPASKRLSSNDEANRLLKAVPGDSLKILLDSRGDEFSSQGFAGFMQAQMNSGKKFISFIICGEDGATKYLQENVDMVLSLSQFTFTHEMARVILLEQVYRAVMIIHNHPYHK